MKSVHPELTTFFHFTDPATAKKIAAGGFESAGAWSHEATVTIMDRPPAGIVGAVLRVVLPPDAAAAALKHERPSATSVSRTYAVPIELLRHAYVTLVNEAATPAQ